MFSNPSHIMTLANSVIGVGILAMPFCFQKCGIILSVVLLILSNCITCICCHYLIKCSLLTRRKSFELLGFQAFGSSGKLLVELCIIGYLLGTCITYYVVVGDLGPQIIMKMFNIEGQENSHIYRTVFMCAVTILCILPLGMLKKVDSLSAVCTASIGFYICLAIKIVLESDEHMFANDWQQRVVYWESGGILQCLPIFSMALSCQMQLFEVFGSIQNQSLEKLNGIVKNAIWICTFVYIAVGFFGYVAFCTQKFSGNILVNLSASFSSDVIKIGFIISLAFSFPLVIFPCRASIYSLLYRREQGDANTYIPDSRFKVITIFIVLFSLGIALMIPSVELIIGLVGSTIGVAVCIMYPALCFRKIVKKDSTERNLAQFIILSGFCLMVLGTYANLNAIDEKSSGAHLAVQNLDITNNYNNAMALPSSLDAGLSVDSNAKLTNENKQADVNIDKPIIPPLPIDEKHEERDIVKNQNSPDKLQVVSPASEIKIVEIAQSKEAHKVEYNIEGKTDMAKKIIENSSNLTVVPQAHVINKDAFKKEEEIAAEEKKALADSKVDDNEKLKETQNELKETKKLLDELKVEIVKQNMDAQELVAEKLDAVVEKVEDIERIVQEDGKKDESNKNAADEKEKTKEENAIKPQNLDKGTLLNILSEAANNMDAEEAEAHKGVYEPKSYKSGVAMEQQMKNLSEIKSRLPLPLARKTASKIIPQKEPLQNDMENHVINNQNKFIRKEINNKTNIFNKAKQHLIAKDQIQNQTLEQNDNKKAEAEVNLEAIRRDILQFKENRKSENLARAKRESQNNIMDPKNCLVEPNIEILCPDHSNDFKLTGLIRKLNSINEKDNN